MMPTALDREPNHQSGDALLMKAESPRIIFASNFAYSDLHAGLLDFSRERGWILDASMVNHPGWIPRTEGCAGIIASIGQEKFVDWIVKNSGGCPVVQLLHSDFPTPPWPAVVLDCDAIDRIGARHLLELGNPTFAFYRYYLRSPDINEIHDGFVNEMATHGRMVHSLTYEQPDGLERRVPRNERIAWIAEQLRRLLRPLAVMGAEDRFAADVALAAHSLGLRIPQDIAILGGNDQILYRKVVSDELSSIDVNFREVARLGCELLDRILKGAEPGSADVPMLTKVQPKEVMVRQSTVTFNCDHPGVTAAAIFVRQHFREPISVADVANQAGMSVRSLQAEYPGRVGCTVKEDIVRARLKHAQFLLERTELKVAAVASESGFGKLEYLCRVFQNAHQMTPHAWRLKYRQA